MANVDDRAETEQVDQPVVHPLVRVEPTLKEVGDAHPERHVEYQRAKEGVEEEDWEQGPEQKDDQVDEPDLCIRVLNAVPSPLVVPHVTNYCLFAALSGKTGGAAALSLVVCVHKVR